MGAEQSKLREAVLSGDTDQIRALHKQGAILEYCGDNWRTPLILACMKPELIGAAQVLIDLGADVHAYGCGFDAGSALHHAAEKGLVQTVKLLLENGANPCRLNGGGKTPLHLARSKGHCDVVRALEKHMALFRGWMRIVDGPSIIEAFAPQWVQRQIWVVVLPRRSPNSFDLVYYSNKQAVQPEKIIFLGGSDIVADVGVPNYDLPDPAVVITKRKHYAFEKDSTTWYKFLPFKKGDKEQLRLFYKACQGLSK